MFKKLLLGTLLFSSANSSLEAKGSPEGQRMIFAMGGGSIAGCLIYLGIKNNQTCPLRDAALLGLIAGGLLHTLQELFCDDIPCKCQSKENQQI